MKTKDNSERARFALHAIYAWVALAVALNLLAYVLAGEPTPFIWWPVAWAMYHVGRISVITEEPACVA